MTQLKQYILNSTFSCSTNNSCKKQLFFNKIPAGAFCFARNPSAHNFSAKLIQIFQQSMKFYIAYNSANKMIRQPEELGMILRLQDKISPFRGHEIVMRVVIFLRASGARFHFNNLIEFITGEGPDLETLSRTSYLPLKQKFCVYRTTRANRTYPAAERFAAHGQEIIRFRRPCSSITNRQLALPLALRKRTTSHLEAHPSIVIVERDRLRVIRDCRGYSAQI